MMGFGVRAVATSERWGRARPYVRGAEAGRGPEKAEKEAAHPRGDCTLGPGHCPLPVTWPPEGGCSWGP